MKIFFSGMLPPEIKSIRRQAKVKSFPHLMLTFAYLNERGRVDQLVILEKIIRERKKK